MGNLIHAGENYHRVVEIVRSGVLGKVSKARVWLAADRSGMGRPDDGAPPKGCDYDFWLGPAPRRPFNPNRFTFNWRYFWDYGGGILTDFCCHIVDLVHWAMDVEAPRTISAVGGRYALDTAKGADLGGPTGRLIIDLNFLYHPSCRYNDAWVCPLAPPGNTISTPVNAGERL